MAISSPNVIDTTDKNKPDLFTMGFQTAQTVMQLREQKRRAAMNTFRMLDKMATDPSMAGGWNALLKREGVRETLGDAYRDMGVKKEVANELMDNLGEAIPSPIASMEMVQGIQTYFAKGEKPPPEFYQTFSNNVPPGEQRAEPKVPPGDEGMQVPPTQEQEITGKTYEWQEEKKTVPTTTAPETTEQATVIPTDTFRFGKPEVTVEEERQLASTPIKNALETAEVKLEETKNKLDKVIAASYRRKVPIAQQLADLSALTEDLRQAQTTVDQLTNQLRTVQKKESAPIPIQSTTETKTEKPEQINISTPSTVNTPVQQQQIISGKWKVASENEVIGEVTDGVFRPNEAFKWTNETEMLKGMSRQTWGEENSDVSAFKNMLYQSAIQAGYKGSKEKFFKAKKNVKKMGRPSSHGAWMPEWYDWAKENGIEIKQPVQVSTVEALKYDDNIPAPRVNAIKNVENRIIQRLESSSFQGTDLTGKKITTYTASAAPESGAGGYVTKDERIGGYLSYEEAKEQEKFLRQHSGHYGDLLFKDKKTYNSVMEHHYRVYQNLGGDKIMDVLAPNKMELERAKLSATIDMTLYGQLVDIERIKSNEELGYAGLELKKLLGDRELDLKKYGLDLQVAALSEEIATKRALANMKSSEMTEDTASKLFERGFKALKAVRDQKPDKSGVDLYATDEIYRYGINNLIRSEAIQIGIPPNEMVDRIEFIYEKNPTGIDKLLEAPLKSLGAWPKQMPTLGALGKLEPETETEVERKKKLAEQQEQNMADIEELKRQGLIQ